MAPIDRLRMAESANGREDSTEPTGDAPANVRSAHEPLLTFTLLSILAVFIALSALIALKTPAYESADEPSHVQNIETLVSGHWYGMNSKSAWTPFGACTALEPKLTKPLSTISSLLVGKRRSGFQYTLPIMEIPIIPLSAEGILRSSHRSRSSVSALAAPPRGDLWHADSTVHLLRGPIDNDEPMDAGSSRIIRRPFSWFVFLSAFVTNDNLVNLLGAILTYLALKFCPNSDWLADGGSRDGTRSAGNHQTVGVACSHCLSSRCPG